MSLKVLIWKWAKILLKKKIMKTVDDQGLDDKFFNL